VTLSDLIQEVYTLTGRPDRVAETLSAIKSATLKAHQSDFFYKDVYETGLNFGGAAYVQQLNYRVAVPNYRSLKYLRKYDPTTNTPGKTLDLVVPENIFDGFQIQKQDICYAAGAYININSSTQEQYYLFGCYVNPDITTLGYTSWIALDHPYAIVFDAASTVFKAIGKDEEAAAYRLLVPEQLSLLKASNIIADGY